MSPPRIFSVPLGLQAAIARKINLPPTGCFASGNSLPITAGISRSAVHLGPTGVHWIFGTIHRTSFAIRRIGIRNAVRLLAGLGAPSYTDATITPGVTMVKAAHVTELCTALNAARSTLSLPAISYSRPTLTTGVALISAADISELRNGTQ